MATSSIDIIARGPDRQASVSLRFNERISNLRALVAVRFEQPIVRIVLVFGGQVLRDVGTIDGHGIIAGVIVHVVFRTPSTPASKLPPLSQSEGFIGFGKRHQHAFASRSASYLKKFLEEPATLRDLLQNDTRFKGMLEENAQFRHYLNSDRNLREVLSTALNPAKVQELGRRRDLYILRMESVPGGPKLLGRLNYYMREAYENSVAHGYQTARGASGDNPQRGRENCLPLPNPWRPEANEFEELAGGSESCVVEEVKQQCEQLMKSVQHGDIHNSLEAVRVLTESASRAHRILERRVRRLMSLVEGAATMPNMATETPPVETTGCFSSIWERIYQPQLLKLTEMGYTDRRRNICSLIMTFGNMESAVKLLEHWKQ